MPATTIAAAQPGLPVWQSVVFGIVGLASFQLAYTFDALAILIFVYLWCLLEISRQKTGRKAFYTGLAMGLATLGVQLSFFWNIFGTAAIALWIIVGLWIAMFTTLARSCRNRFGKTAAIFLIPFLWTGLEYFRSELYYLRFSWLNEGYVFSNSGLRSVLGFLGMYGMGFVLMMVASLSAWFGMRKRIFFNISFVFLLAVVSLIFGRLNGQSNATNPINGVEVGGIQMEFPTESDVLYRLKSFAKNLSAPARPNDQLIVLSECTFDGPVPPGICNWCKANHRWLIAGGKTPAGTTNYFNTAFVINTNGDVVFSQVKSVPVQFFKDGLPATEQKLWQSPWGPMGICICYDLSYTRVTDELVRQGAKAIIVPTMDVADWGLHQHLLHARVAPTRAAEYGIPIFRVASSGISQLVDSGGNITASAPFRGEGEILSGALDLTHAGSLPLDRHFAPLTVGVTAVVLIICIFSNCKSKSAPTPSTHDHNPAVHT
jgi:apolipoprotein N-acyltransferase